MTLDFQKIGLILMLIPAKESLYGRFCLPKNCYRSANAPQIPWQGLANKGGTVTVFDSGRRDMATSKLQREVSELLSVHFGGFTIRENYRPEWMIADNGSRIELDFFIEELMVAIEVQGEQHRAFIPHFHKTIETFNKRVEYDKAKKRICEERGIILIEIFDSEQAQDVIPFIIPKHEVKRESNRLSREKRIWRIQRTFLAYKAVEESELYEDFKEISRASNKMWHKIKWAEENASKKLKREIMATANQIWHERKVIKKKLDEMLVQKFVELSGKYNA